MEPVSVPKGTSVEADGSPRAGAPPCRWTFDRAAYAAMERHVHALRWAGQTSGHAPPDDDPFLNHTFGPDWVQMTFE
jgi:hypothetical protein